MEWGYVRVSDHRCRGMQPCTILKKIPLTKLEQALINIQLKGYTSPTLLGRGA